MTQTQKYIARLTQLSRIYRAMTAYLRWAKEHDICPCCLQYVGDHKQEGR